MDKWEHGVNALIASAMAALVTFVSWLLRRVMTNDRKIALLEADLSRREKQREEDRQDVKDVKSDIKDIKNFLLERGVK